MSKTRHPNRGSLQFWPRKRSKHSLARIRTWAPESKVKPLGFVGYKAGMTHLHAVDNRAKSITKGETIALPATVIECPPMQVFGVVFYKPGLLGLEKSSVVFAGKFDKHLAKTLKLPKKQQKKFDDIKEFSDLRLLVHSQPALTGIGSKKPKVLEIALGGNKDEKLTYAKDILGKIIPVGDIFSAGIPVDIHGISKGKGFQGTVKRYGVPIMQHKAEKLKRGIGNLGAWTPKRVQFEVPQPGKMGYHLRTEYNKHIISIGEDSAKINSTSGFTKYGNLKNHYILIKGSVVGPRKRAIVLTKARRTTRHSKKESYEVKTIAQ